MAQIYSGGRAGLQALMYGETSYASERYFESQLDRGIGRLRESAMQFVDQTREYGFLATEYAKRTIRKARQRVTWAHAGNYVRELTTLNDFRYATPRMIDYVMAEPETRRAYHGGRLAGYDDDYVDHQPNVVGDKHAAYRRVMDGIIEINDDEDSDLDYRVTHYVDDVDPDNPPLEFDEQNAILRSWQRQQHRLAQGGKDFTSLRNASLD